MNVTIAEALSAKHKIENAFLMALREFVRETGLHVIEVEIVHVPQLNRIGGINIRVELQP